MGWPRLQRFHRINRVRFTVFVVTLTMPLVIIHENIAKYSSQLDLKFKTEENLNITHSVVLPDYIYTDFFSNSQSNVSCYIKGTYLSHNTTDCQCRRHFFGVHCGIPASVWLSKPRRMFSKESITIRENPRRVINAFPFNHEFDLLTARLHELNSSVDVYVILETNVTSAGTWKPLRLYEKLKENHYQEFLPKIVYIRPDVPRTLFHNGWDIEEYLRKSLVLGFENIENIADDDLFILSDADEIPSKEVVDFLKFYDGYTEPITFRLKWTIFGFFWNQKSDEFNGWFANIFDKSSTIPSASTIQMLRETYHNNPYNLRSNKKSESHQTIKNGWTIGSSPFYAGWHCSWCLRPNDIITKLDSAQMEDKPRWGDYPEKKNLSYINYIINKGMWFDNIKSFRPVPSQELMFAPSFILQNPEKYRYLLDRPRNRP